MARSPACWARPARRPALRCAQLWKRKTGAGSARHRTRPSGARGRGALGRTAQPAHPDVAARVGAGLLALGVDVRRIGADGDGPVLGDGYDTPAPGGPLAGLAGSLVACGAAAVPVLVTTTLPRAVADLARRSASSPCTGSPTRPRRTSWRHGPAPNWFRSVWSPGVDRNCAAGSGHEPGRSVPARSGRPARHGRPAQRAHAACRGLAARRSGAAGRVRCAAWQAGSSRSAVLARRCCLRAGESDLALIRRGTGWRNSRGRCPPGCRAEPCRDADPGARPGWQRPPEPAVVEMHLGWQYATPQAEPGPRPRWFLLLTAAVIRRLARRATAGGETDQQTAEARLRRGGRGADRPRRPASPPAGCPSSSLRPPLRPAWWPPR